MGKHALQRVPEPILHDFELLELPGTLLWPALSRAGHGRRRLIALAGMRSNLDDVVALVNTISSLTPRQREIACLLVQRATNKEVAARLGLSVHTVKRHVEVILLKLGVSSRRDVTRWADELLHDQVDQQLSRREMSVRAT